MIVSLEVLGRMRIEGRQVMSTGAVLAGSQFQTNLAAHAQILRTQMIRDHGLSAAQGRHVGRDRGRRKN